MKNSIRTKILRLSLALVLTLLLAPAAWAETWQVDPDHSAAHFSIQHMMIAQVRGSFPDIKGTIAFQDGTPTAFDITINVDSLSTGVAKRDEHLKSSDFFEAATYPVMHFKSTGVEPAKDGVKVMGKMTIKGVTRDVDFIFTGLDDQRVDPWKNVRRGGAATFVLDRRDFNIIWNQPLGGGGFMIGNDVNVVVDIEAIQPK